MKTIYTSGYQVIFNDPQYDSVNQYIDTLNPSKLVILTDSNTSLYCLENFLSKLKTTTPLLKTSIPAGEKHKNIESCNLFWKFLSENEADRNSLVINLGGGVVTDLGGFVASTFMRGIDYINIPTTLLAMVDASVGGKTGIDLGLLKNQIGLVVNPKLVFVDTKYLETLPSEQFNSGVAEILKHGLIASKDYWSLISTSKILNDKSIERIIYESVEIKKSIVEQDPLEKNLRMTLNFGHTLGHALETYSNSKENKTTPLLHGEAIAIGLILAGFISTESLGFSKEKLQEITNQYYRYFNRISLNSQDIKSVIDLLKFDKKNVFGAVNFVLLKDIGSPVINQRVSNDLIIKAFEYYLDSK
ncbi:3-dehydroquinate synthase [Planktosalinus lacus]|uniref:3-dehydroquinate synthase n=1 Tax=Planktosalinus lacus TaxID=1526573 RepID=A0A8J2Y739_9FLAO|nr:3-dehydroquinate synthase [Planktosalinus lacus]GGD94374.1 3-dehydroquinate synthase [Planktosalinus lacus]